MSTVLKMMIDEYSIRPPKCYICFKKADTLRISLWDYHLEERIKICSDKCLSKFVEDKEKIRNLFQKDKSNKQEPEEMPVLILA